MVDSISNLEYSLIESFASRPCHHGKGPETLTAVANRLGLWIFAAQISALSSDGIDLYKSVRREFGFYSLCHVFGGGGIHWTESNGLHPVTRGDIVISLPNHPHIYGARSGEVWQEDWIAFCGPRADELVNGGLLHDGLIKNALNTRRVRDIARLAQTQTTEGQLRAAVLLEMLLVDLFLEKSGQHAEGSALLVQSLAAEIESYPERDWKLLQMAAQTRLSQSHLRRLFVKQMGLSPQAYVEQKRMARACRLLNETNWLIEKIAEAVGYSDPFYFSTCFRKSFGISPSSYRKVTRLGRQSLRQDMNAFES